GAARKYQALMLPVLRDRNHVCVSFEGLLGYILPGCLSTGCDVPNRPRTNEENSLAQRGVLPSRHHSVRLRYQARRIAPDNHLSLAERLSSIREPRVRESRRSIPELKSSGCRHGYGHLSPY